MKKPANNGIRSEYVPAILRLARRFSRRRIWIHLSSLSCFASIVFSVPIIVCPVTRFRYVSFWFEACSRPNRRRKRITFKWSERMHGWGEEGRERTLFILLYLYFHLHNKVLSLSVLRASIRQSVELRLVRRRKMKRQRAEHSYHTSNNIVTFVKCHTLGIVIQMSRFFCVASSIWFTFWISYSGRRPSMQQMPAHSEACSRNHPLRPNRKENGAGSSIERICPRLIEFNDPPCRQSVRWFNQFASNSISLYRKKQKPFTKANRLSFFFFSFACRLWEADGESTVERLRSVVRIGNFRILRKSKAKHEFTKLFDW